MAEDTIVGHAVTVVVKPITHLCHRPGLTRANRRPIRFTRTRIEHAGLSTLSTSAQVGSTRPDRALDTDAVETIIDDPIAIVIETIADLRIGTNVPGTSAPGMIVLAGLCTSFALTRGAATGSHAAWLTGTQDIVIDRAVAVVIQIIAHFGARPHRTGARPPGVVILTGLLTCLTDPCIDPAHTRGTRSARTQDAIIRSAIAVVIQPITHFSARTGSAYAVGIPDEPSYAI